MSTKKIESRNLDNVNLTRFPLAASFQGVTKLFVLAFGNTNAKMLRKLKETVTQSIFFQE